MVGDKVGGGEEPGRPQCGPTTVWRGAELLAWVARRTELEKHAKSGKDPVKDQNLAAR